ncbi:MAG: hypothetical protein ACAI35_25405 [Candidatus Methylacidiphilales bacterium]
MKMELFASAELPKGFCYPRAFLEFIGKGYTNLTPWHFLHGPQLRLTWAGLKSRYPAYNRVPFAFRQDCDDIACWDASSNERVILIHDFASRGWELLSRDFASFDEWLKQAIKDMVDFQDN